MPIVGLGSTPTELNFTSDVIVKPDGVQEIPFAADAPYPDPNNPALIVRDVAAYAPQVGGVAVKTADYTAVANDSGLLIVFNSASAHTLTLPAAPPVLLCGKWNIHVANIGTGALTVARNGLTIDTAAANLTLLQFQGLYLSTDGTNYYTQRGGANSSAAANFADNETPSGTINGTTTAFTLAHTPNPAGSLILVQDGDSLASTVGYTLSGANLTMTDAPVNTLRAWYRW